jgi:hypothetical protein
VHRRQLMDQWRERLAAFLDLPSGSIGQFGGGKNKRTGVIDVAVIQSLQRKGNVEDFVADYGRLFWTNGRIILDAPSIQKMDVDVRAFPSKGKQDLASSVGRLTSLAFGYRVQSAAGRLRPNGQTGRNRITSCLPTHPGSTS